MLLPSLIRCVNVSIGAWRNTPGVVCHQPLARQQLSVAAELFSAVLRARLSFVISLLQVVAELLLMHFSNGFYTSRINLIVFALLSSNLGEGFSCCWIIIPKTRSKYQA